MEKDKLLKTFKDVAFLSAQKAVDIIKGLRGKANGFASLDSNGKVPLSELDIEIGGRNLLKGTFETEQTLSYPTASGGYTDTGLGRVTTLLNGSTYTLSFWAKSTVNGDKIITHLYSPNIVKSAITNQGVQSTNADGGTVFTLTTEWSKYWVTYTVTPNSNSENAVICPRLRNGNGTGTISIKWQKFEEGNKATDWTPAPEDPTTATTLDGLTASISELNYAKGVTSNIQTQIDDKSDFKCKYKITENTGNEQYYKLLTVSPTGAYANSNYEFHIASRTGRISKVTIYVNSSNDKYLNGTIYYEGNAFPSNYIRGYLYKDTENATSYFEIWVKLSAWNELMFYEKTYQPRSISITWNITKGDSFPSDATTTVTPTATPWYGNAATATKLGTSTVGSVTQPIYLNGGSPTAITYTLEKSVPSDAKFTDTTYGVATSSTLGLVKSGTDITVDANGNVSVNDDSHSHSNYVNQNAFSTVKVGSTSVSADTATDTLTLTAGNNVTITPDATNDKITISSNHPTISKSTDTTSSTSPSAGGTFTTVDSVTRDTNGHVTKVNTKTVTLPSTSVATDSSLNATSTKPIQNKAVTAEFAKYLPLTGGTIDGLMTTNSGIIAKGNVVDYSSIVSGQDSTMDSVRPAITFQYNTTVGSPNNAAILLANIPTNTTSVRTRMYTKIDTGSRFGILQVERGNNARTEINLDYNNFKVISGGQTTFNESFCAHMYGVTCMNTKPKANNTYTLGDGTYRWKQLFANTTTINTSDRRLKKDINLLSNNDNWINFFMKLQPVSFLFKENESGRTHIGFISQDVEDAMTECGLTSLDFAGFCKDHKVEIVEEIEEVLIPADEENGIEEHTEKISRMNKKPVFDENGNPVYIYSLRYEEFIALNTMMIQKMYEKNVELENRLKIIEEKLGI